ncbi:MAG: hypothetical protein WC211_01765 [Dehalococcoidia bacterium]
MKTARRIALSMVFLVVVIGGAAYVAIARPDLTALVEQRLREIGIPAAPIGDITPARDLRGTWSSSLTGKGFQLYGTGTAPQGGTVRVYVEADLILRIDRVEDNVATGAARWLNHTTYGEVIGVPMVGTIPIPRQTLPDTDFQPMSFRVTGSAIDFGTVMAGGAVATMQGSFTEDLLTGWGGGTIAGFDNIAVRSELHLTRCSSRWHGLGCPP